MSPDQHPNQNLTRAAYLSTVFLRALRDGRDPIDAARAADLGYIPSATNADFKPIVRAYMPYAEARRIYFDEFVPALKLSLTSETALMDAIKQLSSLGEIVMGPSQIIYLNPQFIQQLLRPLFDESCGGRLWAQRTLARQDALRQLSTGSGLSDSEKECAIAAADHLVNTGELDCPWLPLIAREYP